MEIAPSTYYSAKIRPPSARAISDAVLMPVLLALWVRNYSVYGRRKLTKATRKAGHDVGRDQVARLMRQLDIRGATRAVKRFTTHADPTAVRAPDLVGRDFTATRPNEKWVADFTYCSTWSGIVYVAFVIDVFSRRIVGRKADRTMHVNLVVDALNMAAWVRRGADLDGVICHSDAGSQGGFNRSSQHPLMMEVAGGSTTAVGGQGASPGDAVAGSADPGASRGARVLASDRSREEHRGRRGWCRRVGPSRVALVSSRWRHGASEPC